METAKQVPKSKHFRLEEMSEGVYAAIHVDGGAAIGNAGIVDLGDRTLVFDTFMAPHAGEDLRVAAESLFDRPIDAVINSHWHNDHVWGNQAFSTSTDIIATEETRRLLVSTRGHATYDDFMAAAEMNLESTTAAYDAAQGQRERSQLKLWVDYHQSVVDARPILHIRPPNVAFTKRMVFHGTERSAVLIPFENGHTQSDTVLFLPQEGIVFMGDLLFIEHQPYLGAGDPDRFREILDEVSELTPRVLLPGHGPVGTADSLEWFGQYIRTLDDLAQRMVEDGVTEETIDEMAVPEPYGDWRFAAFYPLNMHFLYQRWLARQFDAPN